LGYTHYWSQKRNLTDDEWTAIIGDFGEIFKYAQHVANVPLANGCGDAGTQPEIDENHISFNGVGDDAHETLLVNRMREKAWEGGELGGDFCKTDRKPYDAVVTACLCYLDTCLDKPAFYITSDGNGSDFLAGLDLARKALPRKANVLDIPMGVMESDRWTAPWVDRYGIETGFSVKFCVNGKGYVFKLGRKPETYCFPTHLALAEFLDKHKHVVFRGRGRQWYMGNHRTGYDNVEPNIWSATGSFDQERHDRIGKAQAKVLKTLFPVPTDHAEPPPAYVRPMDFPDPREAGTFCYYLDDVLKLHGTHTEERGRSMITREGDVSGYAP
jgi:hypothetical protein